jgi:tyrosine-protein phosphatase SIW14
MFKPTGRICKISLLLALAFVSGSCTSTQAKSKPARPAQWAVAVERQGLGNFYRVSDDLYRGEQPTAEGIAQLRQMGVKTIVDLRDSHSDAAEIGNTPINCEYIPMLAWSPKHEDVVKFLRIVTDKNKTPVFVHCQRGADRTGYMCAAYRVEVCGWSKEAAVDEMVHGGYHFSPLWRSLIDSIMKLDVQQIRHQAGLQN